MKRAILICPLCLGISSTILQLVLLREFLGIFSGNELIVGLLLANWLLITGVGAIIGRFCSHRLGLIITVTLSQLLLALLAPVELLMLRWIKVLFLPGQLPTLGDAFLLSFLVLLPWCLLSGFLLSYLSDEQPTEESQPEGKQLGQVYLADTAGSIAGGLVFTFLLANWLSATETVVAITALNIAVSVLNFDTERVRAKRLLLVSAIGCLLPVVLSSLPEKLERSTSPLFYPGQNVVEKISTAYGELVTTQQNEQVNVYQNGQLISSSNDPASAEESVHYAMLQLSAPRQVLLVGGGLNGSIAELLKYPNVTVDYVELDPKVLELTAKLRPEANSARVRLVNADGRQFIQETTNRYDAILLVLSDPASAQVNRYFTKEFFHYAKEALTQNGVMSLSIPGSENYSSPELRVLSSSIYSTLRTAFPELAILPGPKQFILASAKPISTDFSALLKGREIGTSYVSSDYLKFRFSQERLNSALKSTQPPALVNEDLRPIGYYIHLRYWMSKVGAGLIVPLVLSVALLAGCVFLIRKHPLRGTTIAISTSGFAGIGLEFILLLCYQIAHGSIYEHLGMLISSFMFGSALGVWTGSSKGNSLNIVRTTDFLLAAFSLSLAVTPLTSSVSMLIPLSIAVVGAIVGAQFAASARVFYAAQKGESATIIYALDFMGASLGALLISSFVVPLAGIRHALLLLFILKVLSFILALRTPKEFPMLPSSDQGLRVVTPLALTLFFLAFGFATVSDRLGPILHETTLKPKVYLPLLALLGIGIFKAIKLQLPTIAPLNQISSSLKQTFGFRPFQVLSYFGFALAAFLPIYRCFFTIPFLFCHVCPNKCLFGLIRPYLISGALIMNLEKQSWCYQACPIGILQECGHRLHNANRWPVRINPIPIVALIVVAILYFAIKNEDESVFNYFFRGSYSVNAAVVAGAMILLGLSFFYRRPFCTLLCPIGNLSAIMLKLGHWKGRNGYSEKEQNHGK